MGASLAWEAWLRGYEVTAVCGPTHVNLPPNVQKIQVETASEMLSACSQAFEGSDLFVASAAVLDWEVEGPAQEKLKKEAGVPSVEFRANPDILAELCKRKNQKQFILGFAAETEKVLESGQKKRLRKGCDALFANDVSQPHSGLESTNNSGWWIDSRGEEFIPVCSKAEVARQILDRIEMRTLGSSNADI